MSGLKIRALILTGDGLNCETETAQAFQMAHFESEIRHLNDLISEKMTLNQLSLTYSVIAFPGGFSFGDELTSGKVLALKIQYRLGWNLTEYVARGGLVLGICNGFQTLIRMGIFGREVSITHNLRGHFINKWVKVTPHGNKCVWLRGLGTFEVPVRHAEGRIILGSTRRTEMLDKMNHLGMTCLKYDVDLNGSEESLAGLSDSSGRIFGLMPHPEAFIRWTAYPDWTSQPARASSPGQGLAIFENAYKEAASAK